MAKYQYLFTPLKVGPITVKNRLVFTAHATAHCDPATFLPTEKMKAYYEERAKGGVGWIVTMVSSVDERADFGPIYADIGWWKDEVIPEMKDLVDRVHKYDCKLSSQISHPGGTQWPIGSEDGLAYPAYAPSPIGSGHIPFHIPHECDVEEIRELEDLFANAAERVKKAGCDGVEMMCVHEKLASQFISPVLNQRTDQYGGSTENRFRFLIETLEKIREAVGKDYLVGVRINDSDMIPNGLEPEESAIGAKLIEDAGVVDYISFCEGLYRSGFTIIPPSYSGFEPGYRSVFMKQIKPSLKLPVCMSGRINDPSIAERLLAEGVTDLVGVTRGLIADPYFAKKAMEGKEEDIRPCIGCNQSCQAWTRAGNAGLRCQVNPTAGHEAKYGELSRATSRKKVLIIGSGPGGLECARNLAERGHGAVIYEKENEVGGQVSLLRKLPGRSEFGNIIDWLDLQVKKLGVKVNLGVEITEGNLDEILDKEAPDIVLCATGAIPDKEGRSGTMPFPLSGADQPNVFTYEDVIKGAELGDKVVVLDDFRQRPAYEIAELLAGQGKKVEIVTTYIAWQNFLLSTLELPIIYDKMEELGVKIHRYAAALGINGNKVTCISTPCAVMGNMDRTWELEADSVVLVLSKCANTNIYNILKERGVKVRLIGDALAPRQIQSAILDGYNVARKIEAMVEASMPALVRF